MASFFGEVKPLFSRAVDDEEVDIPSLYEVFVDGITNCNAKLMIIAVGEIASIFVKSCFLQNDSNPIFSVKYALQLKKITVASVYKSCPDVLICDIPKSVPEEICFEITDLLLSNCMSSEILILTSKHMAAFKGESSVHSKSPFFKNLGTSNYTNFYSCNVSRLNPPNFLTNMPASVLLQCETAKIPAICFINYIDTDAVDYLNVQMFDKILSEPIVSKVPVDVAAREKVIKFVKAAQLLASNLYT